LPAIAISLTGFTIILISVLPPVSLPMIIRRVERDALPDKNAVDLNVN
jgi:hypothetical protein